MKFGFCEWVFPEMGPSVMKLSHKLGANCISIDDHVRDCVLFPFKNKWFKDEYLEQAKLFDIEIGSMCANTFAQNGGLQNDMDSEKGRESLKIIERDITACEEMNIPILTLPCFWSAFISDSDDEKIENTVKMLKESCSLAAQCGVTIALETALSPKKTKELFDAIKKDNLKILFDTQNTFFHNGSEPASELREYGAGNIAEIHVKDGTKETMGGVLLGRGETGLKKTIETIKNIGYEGNLLIESHYEKRPLAENNDFERLAREDIQTLKEILRGSDEL